MNLQARYDLEIEKDRLGAELDGIRDSRKTIHVAQHSQHSHQTHM